MERSAAYKWAGHVVPGSWPDWEDHMAHAGEDGEGVGGWGGGEGSLSWKRVGEEQGCRAEKRGEAEGSAQPRRVRRRRVQGPASRSVLGPARAQHH